MLVQVFAEMYRKNERIVFRVRVRFPCAALLRMTGQLETYDYVVIGHFVNEDGVIQVFIEAITEDFDC